MALIANLVVPVVCSKFAAFFIAVVVNPIPRGCCPVSSNISYSILCTRISLVILCRVSCQIGDLASIATASVIHAIDVRDNVIPPPLIHGAHYMFVQLRQSQQSST